MSKISDQINEDLVAAMKAKDEVSVSTLRLLAAAFKNKQIELGHELTDEEVLEVISRSAKQRKESIDAYSKGGREDLAAKEKAELEVIGKFLPEQLGEDEIGKVVDEVISQTNATSKAEMGKVIGGVMQRLKGQADGGVVSRIVSEKLS